jgi:hypothetical protein
MFIKELTPVAKEFVQQPVAFLGGFVSGVLKLNLGDDPLATWLKQQGIDTSFTQNSGDRPQSIKID